MVEREVVLTKPMAKFHYLWVEVKHLFFSFAQMLSHHTKYCIPIDLLAVWLPKLYFQLHTWQEE